MVTDKGNIKCDCCGKFVSPDKAAMEFTPDSAFTVERIEYYCQKCK